MDNETFTLGTNWRAHFLSDRERDELDFAGVYSRDFHHGTTGHNQLMLLAKLGEMLDRTELDGAVITYPLRVEKE